MSARRCGGASASTAWSRVWDFGRMCTGWPPSCCSPDMWATTRLAFSSRSRATGWRSRPSSGASWRNRRLSLASTPSTRRRSRPSENGRFASPRVRRRRGCARSWLPTLPSAMTASVSCSIATTAATATHSSTAPTAARGSRSRNGSRTTGRTRRWRASSCAERAATSTTTHATDASTPNRWPARHAAPASGSKSRRRSHTAPMPHWPRRKRALARRCRGCDQGPGWLPPGL